MPRGGRTITWKGRFRDPARSTGGKTMTSEELRWVGLMMLMPPPRKRGPKPTKGARQPRLATRVADAARVRTAATAPWYGGADKEVEVTTGTALWRRSDLDPLPLRWVLVRRPQGSFRPLAFFMSQRERGPRPDRGLVR